MEKNRMVKVKICGITCLDDALAASQAGADAIGFVFANRGKRQVTPEQVTNITSRLDPFLKTVGVFVNAPLEYVIETKKLCGLDVVQLHGEEDEEYVSRVPGRVIKAVTPHNLPTGNMYKDATLLVDQPGGGTGRTFDWNKVVDLASIRNLILAGGLNADNVEQAIEVVRPYAVDVSSGVEMERGRKDHDEIRRFIEKAKSAK